MFAAIDAMDLPLRDASVDLVYGFAFAHHLPDVERFLGEVIRVLRPGGRCVLMDNAYSPAWQHVKLRWLRPLMRLSHRREPRSPEDVRETMAGGFREERLARSIRARRRSPVVRARRVPLLLLAPGVGGAVSRGRARRAPPRPDSRPAACGPTDLLSRFGWARKNMIRLIWGFDKPRRAARSADRPLVRQARVARLDVSAGNSSPVAAASSTAASARVSAGREKRLNVSARTSGLTCQRPVVPVGVHLRDRVLDRGRLVGLGALARAQFVHEPVREVLAPGDAEDRPAGTRYS